MKKLVISFVSLFVFLFAVGCGEVTTTTTTTTTTQGTTTTTTTQQGGNTTTTTQQGGNTTTTTTQQQQNTTTGVVKGTPNFDVPEEGYDGSEVTLTFYHTMGQGLKAVLDEYIPIFNEIYPNITIEHEQVGGYDDVRNQISTELTTGDQPNIAYCYPDHVALYNIAEAVTTLDNLIDSQIEVTREDGSTEILGLTQEQIDDFIPGYYNEGREFGDGLMYTMPFSKSTEVLYYNKTFFDQHSLSVPTHWFSTDANDTTSVEYVAKKIKEIDNTSIPLGYDSESNLFITMTQQLGTPYTSATGEKFLFDNAENKEFVKKFRSFYQDGLMTTQEIYGAYTSGLFVQTDPDLVKSYMSIGSSAGASHQCPTKVDGAYPFEVGIAPIPQANPANPKVISQGPSVCIFQKDDPQEVIASWLFIKFLTTSVEFQASFSMESGYVPVLKSVGEHPVYKEFVNQANGGDFLTSLSAKVCLEQADAYYTSPAFNGSSTARDQVGLLLQAALVGNATTDAEIDALIDGAFADAIEYCKFFS